MIFQFFVLFCCSLNRRPTRFGLYNTWKKIISVISPHYKSICHGIASFDPFCLLPVFLYRLSPFLEEWRLLGFICATDTHLNDAVNSNYSRRVNTLQLDIYKRAHASNVDIPSEIPFFRFWENCLSAEIFVLKLNIANIPEA